MGRIGRILLGGLGRVIGGFAGDRLGGKTGIHGPEGGSIGNRIGSAIGDFLPFKKGGRIKRNMVIRAHKGEFILPKGVKPTKAQIKKVMKKRAPKKSRKRR